MVRTDLRSVLFLSCPACCVPGQKSFQIKSLVKETLMIALRNQLVCTEMTRLEGVWVGH